MFKKLGISGKLVANVSTQLIAAAKACSQSNRNQASQIQVRGEGCIDSKKHARN